jgi:PAS domain S-box-containing protein
VDVVNRSYAEQTGQPREQALGSGWQAMLHPEDLEGYLEVWKASLLCGEAFQREVRMRRADGSWRWHLNMAHAARDAEGRLLRWFGVALELEGRGEA